ncbi:MAG: hypothetical protein CL565_00190 [Alphaproteobacteria bacterium]|nr:hypothetical protein [Alphaproteobacteria bacterium]|tara:strand:+ start:1486 stop:2064 length:579 start_codon:yes stop_codon:yes gene_type:complete
METSHLNTEQIIIGLSWDPLVKPQLTDKIFTIFGQNKESFDLDLSCYIYGKDNSFLDYVSGMPGEMIDKSGSIRHSGDDRDGAGPDDDEQIKIDFIGLPEDVQNIIIVVEVASAHAFKDIFTPSARIVDVQASTLFFNENLKDEHNSDTSACVLGRLERTSENGDWTLHPIKSFLNHEYVEDWSEFLTEFLS